LNVIEDVLGSPGRIRILRVLLHHNEVNITKLVKETGMHYRLVVKHLKILEQHGIVIEKRYGRARIIALNRDNPLTQLILEVFNRLDTLEQG